MRAIDISQITGTTFPYLIYACDVYGNQCILLAVVNTSVPPSNTIVLPPQFNSAPAVGIKVVDNDGCERFHILYCISPTPDSTPTPTPSNTLTPTSTPTPTNTPT